MTDNRTTELRISEPLRGFIKHQSNRAYIDGGQASWLTKIADEIDAKHEQAVAATLGSERERALEKLVRDMWREITTCPDYPIPPCMTRSICDRIRELGIEVSA